MVWIIGMFVGVIVCPQAVAGSITMVTIDNIHDITGLFAKFMRHSFGAMLVQGRDLCLDNLMTNYYDFVERAHIFIFLFGPPL